MPNFTELIQKIMAMPFTIQPTDIAEMLIIAYVIELLGWFGVEKQPLTMRKVAGMAIAIIGVVIFEK